MGFPRKGLSTSGDPWIQFPSIYGFLCIQDSFHFCQRNRNDHGISHIRAHPGSAASRFVHMLLAGNQSHSTANCKAG